MLPGACKHGIIISDIPVIQAGLVGIMTQYFPGYELSCNCSVEELTLLQLGRASLTIVDLTGDFQQPRQLCAQYYSLLTQYRDIHWIFLVSHSIYSLAVEQLMGPESTLLSEQESVDNVIEAVRAGSRKAERISQLLLSHDLNCYEENDSTLMLTMAERKVLRLIGKGWSVNQIAILLKKSNKTVSAQKNSAMRRLSLRSNAEMYVWINSVQGMRELNLSSADGEHTGWKRIHQSAISPSLKDV